MKKTSILFLVVAVGVATLIYYLHHRPVMTMKVINKQTINHKKNKLTAESNKEKVSQPSHEYDVRNEFVDKISPFISNGDATGEISIDLSNYQHIQVGSKILLETISGSYPITVNDIVLNDDGSLSYELLGDDGTNSLFIYFPDAGTSYVSLSTQDMYLTSFLNENGVGEYTNTIDLIQNEPEYNSNEYMKKYIKDKNSE